MVRYFLTRTGGRVTWATGLTTTTLMAMLMVPLAAGTFIAAVQLRDVAGAGLSHCEGSPKVSLRCLDRPKLES